MLYSKALCKFSLWSKVAFLILGGILVMWAFARRQNHLIAKGKDALTKISLLSIKTLKAGLSVLMSQYIVIASVFFIVPVYLQTVLGKDAIQTGLKILPLSVALLLFSVIGMKLVNKFSPRKIVRIGQVMLIFGAILLLGAVDVDLKSFMFGFGMFVLGAGLGLLASQLGNVNMSSSDVSDSNEIGVLQGVFQNLGSSFGTALIGSVLIASLSTGFINSVNDNPNISTQTKSVVTTQSPASLPIVPSEQVEAYGESKGLNTQEAEQVADSYEDAQISGLKNSLSIVAAVAALSLILSTNIPSKSITQKD